MAKAAAVQGELTERPLPRLLQQLYRKQFTGHFVIADQTRDESEVYVRDGSPVHVCRPVDTDRLDNLLVEYGLVPAEVVAQASAQVTEGQRLGAVLERMGVMDKEKLAQVLKAQVTRKLTRLFFVNEGTYAVYLSTHEFGRGEDLQLMRVDPRSVIYPGIRAAYDLTRVTRELSRLAGQRFRLSDISSAFVAALGVPPEDATIEALRGGWMTIDDLDYVSSRPFEVRSIALAMYYTDSLDRESLAPSSGETEAAGPSPSSSSIGIYRVSRVSSESGVAFNLDGTGAKDRLELAEASAAAVPPSAPAVPSGAPEAPRVLAPPPAVAEPPPVVLSSPVVSPPQAAAAIPPVAATSPTAMPAPPVVAPVAASPPAVTAPARAQSPVASATAARPPAPTPAVSVSSPTVTSTASARVLGPSPVSPATPVTRQSGTIPVAAAGAATRPLGTVPPANNGTSPAAPAPQVSPGVPVIRAPFVTAAKPATRFAPAAKPAPGPEAIRASITEMAAKLDKSTHFEILGVSVNASADEVGTAFVRAARQFHPDRLTGAGVTDLQPLAERILSRINEAAMVLGSPPRRAEYCESLKAGAQASQNLPTLLEAENLFLKGEVFLKKGDHGKAIEAFTAAVKNNPGEPQYQAYLAWTRFEDPRARKEVIVRDTLKLLEGVLKERPRFARGHYWVGQLWKFLNEAGRAEQAFRQAVQADDTLIEASRELRLIEMRKSKSPAKPAGKPESKGRFWKR